jgi:carbohydrate-binding DOMON domain-containing protein
MKIASNGYMHEARISVALVPETDVEETLLKSLWKHGHMEIVYGPTYQITQGQIAKAEEREGEG